MAQQAINQILSFKAAADLSNSIYKVVKMTGNQTVDVVSAVNDIPVGVLVEPAGEGKAVGVAISGTVKVLIGGTGLTINAGDVLAIANDGTVVKYDSTNNPQKVGIALEGGSTGSYIEMLIRIL
jgi:hypothetical protein